MTASLQRSIRYLRRAGQKISRHVAAHGIAETAFWAAGHMRDLCVPRKGRKTAASPDGLAFDAEMNVETENKVSLAHLDIDSPNFADGVEYQASVPEECRSALRRLQIDPSEFLFIDMGCGKGRALLIAREFRFSRLIGVEFARELSAICTHNMQVVHARDRHMPAWEVICADAATVDLPPIPTVVYLYNPFGADVMGRVARRVTDSLKVSPRPVYIVYVNPRCLDSWLSTGAFDLLHKDDYCAIAVSHG